MKNKFYNLFIIIGILLVLYPFIGRAIFKVNQTTIISKYRESISQMSDEKIEEKEKKYQEFNNELTENKVINNLNASNVGEILGYIEIPKINVYLSIYEGTSDNILLQGIGHLENSSLPIGGSTTNSVLVGHTGITGKTFFDNLTDLKKEDLFYIYILKEVLTYKVLDIKVVLPNETDYLEPVKGEDIVTLVTCTPKYVNSHRLLVRGKRVQNSITTVNKTDVVENECNKSFEILIFDLIVAILDLILIIVFITIKYFKITN